MTLKFSANLSTMFQEVDLIERFAKAKQCGFNSVEIQSPYEVDPTVLKDHLGDMRVDLINLYCDSPKYGCAALPVMEGEFCIATQKAMPYFYSLNFKKLHILSGVKSDRYTFEEHLSTFVSNLESLVTSDFLENINVVGLIEPICNDVIENYFLNSFDVAVDVIKKVGSDQIKLLLDVYHLHKITGDVHKYLEIYYPYAGHVQVSQDPGRMEPFGSGGKIDYEFVFDFLRQKKHADYIGLEYFPSGSTEESLDWMKKYTS